MLQKINLITGTKASSTACEEKVKIISRKKNLSVSYVISQSIEEVSAKMA